MSKQFWPSWRYGPKGEAAVFECENDVPRGWHDHPSKHEAAKSADPAKTAEAAGAKETKSRAPAKKAGAKKPGRKPKAAAAPLDL